MEKSVLITDLLGASTSEVYITHNKKTRPPGIHLKMAKNTDAR